MRKFYAFLLTAIVFTGVFTPDAAAQNYVLTTSNGVAIVPGTTLVPGSQADDAMVNVALPFTYQVYGTNYTSVNLSTNGNLQFTANQATFTNVCPLPSALQGVAFMPHWDDLDLRTDPARGIYTSISGSAPNRIFNIEWRAIRFGGTNPVNFQARLYEGQQRVDFVYGNVDGNGLSASVGVQAPPTLQTTYSCNAANLSPGLQLHLHPHYLYRRSFSRVYYRPFGYDLCR